jgi:hypothetical protein
MIPLFGHKGNLVKLDTRKMLIRLGAEKLHKLRKSSDISNGIESTVQFTTQLANIIDSMSRPPDQSAKHKKLHAVIVADYTWDDARPHAHSSH